VCAKAGLGIVAFSPLAQGLLTTKYLSGDIPTNSRAAQGGSFSRSYVSQENITALRALNDIAVERGQSLAQMALAWTLRRPEITSVIVGARTVEQLSENLDAVLDLEFTDAQLRQIEATAVDGGLNLWASRSSDL
jgi:L-glyceraldehyde 3-phosphate reductase